MLKYIPSIINSKRVAYLIFYVTNRCNFNCKFCYYAEEIQKGLKVNELSLEEIDKITKNINNLLQVSFAGGEPFLRKDFPQLAEIFIKNTNVKYVNIPTNGSLNSRIKEFLEYILPKFPKVSFRLTYSIDGIEEQHDTNRSMPGSFKKIVNSFKEISYYRKEFSNLSIDSNTVFTTNTENNIIEILDHLNKNFEFDNLTLTYARGDFPDQKLKSRSLDKYHDALDYLKKMYIYPENRKLYSLYRATREIAFQNIYKIIFENKFVNYCVSGKKLFVISEEGNVYPCEILTKTHPLGNLREFNYDINKIIKTTQAKETYKWIKKTKCKCSFECAVAANVIWDYKNYPKLLFTTIKNQLRAFRN